MQTNPAVEQKKGHRVHRISPVGKEKVYGRLWAEISKPVCIFCKSKTSQRLNKQQY